MPCTCTTGKIAWTGNIGILFRVIYWNILWEHYFSATWILTLAERQEVKLSPIWLVCSNQWRHGDFIGGRGLRVGSVPITNRVAAATLGILFRHMNELGCSDATPKGDWHIWQMQSIRQVLQLPGTTQPIQHETWKSYTSLLAASQEQDTVLQRAVVWPAVDLVHHWNSVWKTKLYERDQANHFNSNTLDLQ